LQVIQDTGLETHRIDEFAAHRMLGIICHQLIESLLQHRFSDDQLADEVENIVNAFRIDAKDVFGLVGRAGWR